MDLPWLKDAVQSLEERIAQGRMPHAIMLLGPVGVGKRCLAVWLAKRHLGKVAALSMPGFPLEVPELADLRWLNPPEDKTAIGVEAVRELIADLSLTSYDGLGKVAVIEPADAMTASAANSLLKTLEEPTGNALLILVVDRAGRLPATIVSRCQRVEIALPKVAESLSWLSRLKRSDHWEAALCLADKAPLRVLDEADRQDDAEAMARDFAALANNEAQPLETAARWLRFDTVFVLDWLCRQVEYGIRRSFGQAAETAAVVPDFVLQRMDRRKLFCYLDMINRVRRQADGSYNVQLTLESLLIDWAEGLRDCRSAGDSDSLRLSFTR
jgi:DNA polymerase III subunit delta'